MYLGKIRNSGQTADKPKFWQKEKPTKGFVKPNVSWDCGDPYGNRTHDSAVKGRRLNRLTNGPKEKTAQQTYAVFDGSGNRIRTNDTLGMNQVL